MTRKTHDKRCHADLCHPDCPYRRWATANDRPWPGKRVYGFDLTDQYETLVEATILEDGRLSLEVVQLNTGHPVEGP